MVFDASKLLTLKGSAAARAPKIGVGEPTGPANFDLGKLLLLKGSDVARTAKVGAPEPVAPVKK